MSERIGAPVRLNRTINQHAEAGSAWVSVPSQFNPGRVNLYKVTQRETDGPIVWKGLMILEVADKDVRPMEGRPTSLTFT